MFTRAFLIKEINVQENIFQLKFEGLFSEG
jgi:hypothetical protein